MRVDTRPRKKNSQRADEVRRVPPYLKWLRGRKCAANRSTVPCEGFMEAAHVDHAGGKGVGLKVADEHALPLCAGHHARQHRRGWLTFERECLGGKSAVAMAAAYWNEWLFNTPMGKAWRDKQDA